MALLKSEDGSSDHDAALQLLLDALRERGFSEIHAAGHRVVHGGPDRTGPARIDSALLDELRARIPLAPLHLPQEVRVIEATTARWPSLPQVACFDTAFHRRMPEIAQRFPLSRRLFDEGVRRYGFHGLSYEYVRQALGNDVQGRVIIAHLGHGSSLVALRDGEPIDTTMGFTPSGGVMMATRSGDLDPGVLLHLLERGGWDGARLARLINHEAGLLGVSGLSADMRRLLELRDSNAHADQAVTMFCRSVRKAIGALATDLGGLDLLVFTGGIGERAPAVRREICQGLEHLGVLPGEDGEPRSSGGAPCSVRVVSTDENLMIARQTWNLLFGGTE
jgi:acetate kinase